MCVFPWIIARDEAFLVEGRAKTTLAWSTTSLGTCQHAPRRLKNRYQTLCEHLNILLGYAAQFLFALQNT
jgi:hypothetical protein